MNHASCDICGQALRARDQDQVRYEMTIEIKAAYDPLEITAESLATDFREEIARVLRQLEGLSAEEAQEQIYKRYAFDLCVTCQRKIIRQPLAVFEVSVSTVRDSSLPS